MKKAIILTSKTLFLSALLLFAFSSCEKPIEPENNFGQLKFIFSANDFQDNLKSGGEKDSAGVYTLLISVEDDKGSLVLDKEPIALYWFSDGFVSKNVELKKGNYTLTEFMVVNRNGEVTYATPKVGAPLAYLVVKPLPVDFSISANASIGLRMEVIPVANHPAEEFGYINFGFSIVKPLTFYTAAYIDNQFMSYRRLIKAQLSIYDPEGKHYQFKLDAKINELVIKAMRGQYIFVLKTDVYENKFMFVQEDLMNSSLKEPLYLPLGDSTGIHEMLIRTSPENTKDALITDLYVNINFGNHALFAASFKSELGFTVMRTTRSLMSTDGIRRHLPKSATITKVELELTLTGNMYDLQTDSTKFKPAYAGVLRQITEEWKEEGVTWSNQPKTIAANQVIIHYDPWINSNKRIYDISPLFVPMNKERSFDHGFMLSHYPEEIPGGIEFGSSDTKNENDRPLFKVYYTLPN